MAVFKDNKLETRLGAAADAKKALLERFRAKPGADDPEVLKRQAERKAILEAREERARAREVARIEAEKVRLAEEAAREAAEKERAEREYQEKLAREAAREIELKAARDARYAARKERKKRR